VVLPTIVEAETTDAGSYREQPEAQGTSLSRDEQTHRRVIQAVAATSSRGLAGPALGRLEGRHRAVGGNALRAAVLGANDGLVSNLSLVMGVAGAALSSQAILITGFAGLLAGAISMALGEWLSVQSSRELYERQIAIEAEELRASPEDEAAELMLIFQAKGAAADQAREMAGRVIANEATALDTLVREELGIDPAELGGSAWEAAITSFFLFAIGAIIPVLSFLLLTGSAAVITSLMLSAVGLFAIGAAITLFTGRSLLFSGTRQMLFGLAAAAVTYVIGHLMGVSITG
jgi:VIT1/CCC1 family predicted Fe2+/Mn2+ transporter